MLDLDYFKEINDTYGQQTGDMVLHAVPRRLASALREAVAALRPEGHMVTASSGVEEASA